MIDVQALIESGHLTKSFDGSKISAEKIDIFFDFLRSAPSSFNVQPWHFVIASSEAARSRIARAMDGGFEGNHPKAMTASHIVVFCSRQSLPQSHIDAMKRLERESGRFPPEALDWFWSTILLPNVERHEFEAKDTAKWLEKQTYLALGVALMGAAALGIDAAPLEGFFPQVLDAEFGLHSRGLTSIVLLALGRRAADDHAALRPKPRFPAGELFTFLD